MLPGRSHVPHDCQMVADILVRIGDKWSVLIVMLLGERERRFSELQRIVSSISKRMLSLTLRRLERDGIVERIVFDTVPPSVLYKLTPLGRSLQKPIEAVGHWAVDNSTAIQSARASFDARITD